MAMSDPAIQCARKRQLFLSEKRYWALHRQRKPDSKQARAQACVGDAGCCPCRVFGTGHEIHRSGVYHSCHARIEASPADPALLEDWLRFYAGLVARKGITDLRRFDRASFRRQMDVPGAYLVTAWDGEEMLGADLYYLDGSVAYAHLSAYSDCGYAQAVSYPMMAEAIGHFRGRAEWIDPGGAHAGAAGGLVPFKQGWGGPVRTSYLCGRILDSVAYTALSPPEGGPPWFPAYRRGDFRR